MASINVRTTDLELNNPILVEGIPGIGLVGKIATDHLIDQFDMTYYASIDCEGLPQVAVYDADDHSVRPPVRLYADEEHDLLVLYSDVPISRSSSTEFATCVTEWLSENDATPLYLSGLAKEKEADQLPSMYAVTTGDGGRLLDGNDIALPPEEGVVSGPTGALLNRAGENNLDSVGLVVESDPKFPDPEAARVLIEHGIGPITGIRVNTDDLVDRTEEIRDQKEQLAAQMQQADEDESSQAKPLRMYQ